MMPPVGYPSNQTNYYQHQGARPKQSFNNYSRNNYSNSYNNRLRPNQGPQPNHVHQLNPSRQQYNQHNYQPSHYNSTGTGSSYNYKNTKNHRPITKQAKRDAIVTSNLFESLTAVFPDRSKVQKVLEDNPLEENEGQLMNYLLDYS